MNDEKLTRMNRACGWFLVGFWVGGTFGVIVAVYLEHILR